jgi:glycyl-tRNA synthetase beta chain
MRDHQKFFSVKNPKTGRIEGFVTVANVETADQGATILKGNQKVLSARLSDAAFFWENDLRVARAGMQDWLDGLANVTFHAKLGTQAERIARIASLAREIAPRVGADEAEAEEAARVAKADLRSEMVGEFPELQGVMGRYYALAAGRSPAVADAARDHWKPMGAGDAVPIDPVSLAVALADKIDTLTGFWGSKELPTGSKDPFALRRASLAVNRCVDECALRLPLQDLLLLGMDAHDFTADLRTELSNREADLSTHEQLLENEGYVGGLMYGSREDVRSAVQRLQDEVAQAKESLRLKQSGLILAVDDLLAFFHDRLKVHLRDEGIRHDIIDAALAKPPADDLFLVVARARALAGFLATPDGENLVQGFRRAANILHQAESADGVEYRYGADVKFAETPEEKALFAALATAEAAIQPALAAEDFAAAMTQMAALRAPIDAFFEAVQVNAENQIIRRNRLNLLHRIVQTCGAVADLSKLEG